MSASRPSSVVVSAPARLHLGIIDLEGGLGRLFGSVGVALRRPRTVVEAIRRGRGLRVTGVEAERARGFAEVQCGRLGWEGSLTLKVVETAPAHVGLGSGTQLALSVGAAISTLMGRKLDVRGLALAAGRGEVSGVGTAVFQHGGLVVDGGVPCQLVSGEGGGGLPPVRGRLPPVVARLPVPEDWIFVVALPRLPRGGLSGEEERGAFARLPRASPKVVGDISRLVLMGLLPALAEGDIVSFGRALTEMQRLVGDCFAGEQGGRYASPVVASCIAAMLEAGAHGAGQSSWGPACYGLARGQREAQTIVMAVRRVLDATTGGVVITSPPDNEGARIKGKA